MSMLRGRAGLEGGGKMDGWMGDYDFGMIA